MKKFTLCAAALLCAAGSFAELKIDELWNFSAANGETAPEAAEINNGMAVFGSNLYLSRKNDMTNQVALYDAATGTRTKYLPAMADFKAEYGGDVATDASGAIYACDVIVSGDGTFRIVKWDSPDDTEPQLFVSTTAHTGGSANRVGYGMDVKIDAGGNGCIMAPVGATNRVLYWRVENGSVTAQDPEVWTVSGITGDNMGAYARIFIIDENHFWVDGNALRPQYCTRDNEAVTAEGLPYKATLNVAVCGIAEFNYVGKRYAVVAANNHGTTVETPKHSAIIYEMAPEGVSIVSEVATLPAAGLGGNTDYTHFVKPVVRQTDKEVYIYLMGGTNGIAAYKFHDPEYTPVVPPVETKIELENLWEFSAANENAPETAEINNGMDVYGDNLYLSRRADETNQVAIYHSATGLREGYLSTMSGFQTQYGGDVAVDDNGAIYNCDVVISKWGTLHIVKWANAEASPEMFIQTTQHLGTNDTRVGYGMDVCIDTDGNGYVVLPVNGTNKVLYWTVAGNVPASQDPEVLEITGLPNDNMGTCARVFAVDATHFWIDGNAIFPTLCTKEDTTVVSSAFTADASLFSGANGIAEFSFAGKRYAVVAANNHGSTVATPKNSAILYELETEGTTPVAVVDTLPKAGLGIKTNSTFFVKPAVQVKDNEVRIYIMGGANGLAAYRLYDANGSVGIEEVAVPGSEVLIFGRSGEIVIQGAESGSQVMVFDMGGRLVMNRTITGEEYLPVAKGMYIVRVKTADSIKSGKVIVR